MKNTTTVTILVLDHNEEELFTEQLTGTVSEIDAKCHEYAMEFGGHCELLPAESGVN